MFEAWPDLSEWLHWRRLLDVGLVALLIYQLLLVMRGSRSGAVVTAFVILFGLYYVSRDNVLDLPTVYAILDRVIGSIAVLLVVLFQEDIRRAMSSTLRSPLMGGQRAELSSDIIDEITRTCAELCSRGLGGLVVVEQQAPLDRYVEDGIKVDADVSWQLLLAMFIPDHKSPTHDGAVVIKKGRIAAAACFLPLAGGAGIPGTLGSRHRAALGLADETDAVVVVVSEETATCSLAHMGSLDLNLTPADLRERIKLLVGGQPEMAAWREQSWRRRISFHSGPDPAPLRPQVPRDEPLVAAAEVDHEQWPPAPQLDGSDLGRSDSNWHPSPDDESQFEEHREDFLDDEGLVDDRDSAEHAPAAGELIGAEPAYGEARGRDEGDEDRADLDFSTPIDTAGDDE